MNKKGQANFGGALVAVVAVIAIVITQTVVDSFGGTLTNSGAGTTSLVNLFVLLIAVGAVLALLRFAF